MMNDDCDFAALRANGNRGIKREVRAFHCDQSLTNERTSTMSLKKFVMSGIQDVIGVQTLT
uniref:Transposase n=1 Tax=Heterorhabditis bacteriophora TaxID=37862 RepID=A0A1I7WRD1_HETBA